jgi:hypothetical protein
MDCTDGLTSELPVRFQLKIPEFLYFQVGRVDVQEEVVFDLSNTLNSGVFNGNNFPPRHSEHAAETTHGSDNKGELDVVIRSNCGTVNIKYDVSNNQGLEGDNGFYLDYDKIITNTSDTDFPAPTLNNQGDDIVTVAVTSNGVVTDRRAKWTYAYTNNALPAAGVYTGMVSYQAYCP